jgi:hypothetical protein
MEGRRDRDVDRSVDFVIRFDATDTSKTCCPYCPAGNNGRLRKKPAPSRLFPGEGENLLNCGSAGFPLEYVVCCG